MSPGARERLPKLFLRRFWQPLRPHGEVIADRTVSFLELFHDLVYVVVIGRASHTLAGDVSWHGVGAFAVVFGMIFIAWLNGTLYHELHGREDGRGRFYVFVQMLILALLAVFTDHASTSAGRPFALVYTAFLALLTWLWYTVWRLDRPEFRLYAGRYIVGMALAVLAIGASAFLPASARLAVWAVFVTGWVVGGYVMDRAIQSRLAGVGVTDSRVERFGLFVIIVLGEVVVGVVVGLSEAQHDVVAIGTGLIGLMIGFAFWWTYFDYVGRRTPRMDGGRLGIWMAGHFPVTLAIAASGAALVRLIRHAGDARAPAPAAWLLAGSVALGLAALLATMATLHDYRRFPSIYKPLTAVLAGAVLAALGVAWWRPAPWLMALSLVVILSVVWFTAVAEWLRLADPDAALPGGRARTGEAERSGASPD